MELRNKKKVASLNAEGMTIDEPLLCEKCGFKVDNARRLNQHIYEKHKEDADLICSDCFLSFKDENKFKKHVKNHLFCDKCRKVFNGKHELKKHLTSHTPFFSCSICTMRFHSEARLKAHLKKHEIAQAKRKKSTEKKTKKKYEINLNKFPYLCRICGIKIEFNNRFHWKIHRDCMNNYKCNYCEQIFHDSKFLKIHLDTDHRPQGTDCQNPSKNFSTVNPHSSLLGQKKFFCKICEKGFTTKMQQTIHLRLHSGERPYQCKVCLQRFNELGNLRRHSRYMHTDLKCFKCNECGKRVRSATSLKQHELIHTGEKPYSCELCLKSFRTSTALKTHLRVHTGEREYIKCEICGFAARDNFRLKIHMHKHTNERPYPCDHCEKKFKSPDNLRIHKRNKHENKRPYICYVCYKDFASKASVERHLITHFKNGVFACDQCKNNFNNEGALKMHEAEHAVSVNKERTQWYCCVMCGVGFSCKSQLQKHSLEKHFIRPA